MHAGKLRGFCPFSLAACSRRRVQKGLTESISPVKLVRWRSMQPQLSVTSAVTAAAALTSALPCLHQEKGPTTAAFPVRLPSHRCPLAPPTLRCPRRGLRPPAQHACYATTGQAAVVVAKQTDIAACCLWVGQAAAPANSSTKPRSGGG